MAVRPPSVFRRIALAFSTFNRTLRDPGFAQRLSTLATTGHPEIPPTTPSTRPPLAAAPDSALLLLGLLQKEGRLIDFLQEDIDGHSDQEIGAAARVVHQGCRQVLHDHFRIEPVRQENEGTRLTLEPGFDAASVRLSGHVVGEPPFTGTLMHRGWRVATASLPEVAPGHDLHVLAAAEVEL